jgi:predicted DNA-binding transcriptional regulator YafY
MPKKEIAKKTIILYVLDMLEKGSSKEKPITMLNMAKVLNSMDIPCDRRTISRNVDYLIEYGKPIVKIKGGGVYFDHTRNKK